jgi:putative phage-type endonuclease
MMLGSRLEGPAREKYSKKYGVELAPLCVQSVEHPWLRASLDAINPSRDHLVEIKCGKSAYTQAKNGIVPDYYFGQLQHQLQITGLQKIHYWCYWEHLPGIRLIVNRDELYIARLFKAEKAFYNRMKGI